MHETSLRSFHDILKEVSGIKLDFDPGAEAKPEKRAELVDAWFERLAR